MSQQLRTNRLLRHYLQVIQPLMSPFFSGMQVALHFTPVSHSLGWRVVVFLCSAMYLNMTILHPNFQHHLRWDNPDGAFQCEKGAIFYENDMIKKVVFFAYLRHTNCICICICICICLLYRLARPNLTTGRTLSLSQSTGRSCAEIQLLVDLMGFMEKQQC